MASLEDLRARASRAIARLGGAGFRALVPALLLSALWPIGVYVALALAHLRYPFDLEWMEGGMVDHVRRILAGQKLYAKPSLDFTAYIYAPLYFYVAAAFAKVFGVGFFSARLVSVVSSLGVMALLARFVQRETKRLTLGLVAAGFYAGTYRIGGAFQDIARVDSLFVLLLLGAIYLVRFGASPRSRVASAALFTLAFFAKQSAILIFAPVALHVLLAERRRSLWLIVPAAIGMGGGVLLLDWIHGGWFSYYVFWLPSRHGWIPRMISEFWTQDLLAPLAICVLFAAYHLTVATESEGRRLHVLALAGALAVGWSGRIHTGGYTNVIMPAFALLSILFCLGIHTATARAAALPQRNVEALVLAAAILQITSLYFDPTRYLPQKRDREAGEQLVAAVRAKQGDVWVLAHGYVSTLAGKRTWAHEMAIRDVLNARGGGPPGQDLNAELLRALASRQFSALIIDTDWNHAVLEKHYVKKADIFTSGDSFWPITGYRVRPKGVYLPR